MDLAKCTCFKLQVAIMTVGPNRVCNYYATVLPARNSQPLATAGENGRGARRDGNEKMEKMRDLRTDN